MAHLDIIIYGLIAVVLLVRLWAVFGRRGDEDRQRPNPFVTPPLDTSDDDSVTVRARAGRADGAPPVSPSTLLAPMSLAGTLERLKRLDATFDEKQFLQDMRAAFTAIVSAFAKGDLASVENRLGPHVLSQFRAAITARAEASETLENKITRIRESEVTAARIDDDRAFITVRFVSEQENIVRDSAGVIKNGTPGRPEEITDLWAFGRAAKSPSFEWQVEETKS